MLYPLTSIKTNVLLLVCFCALFVLGAASYKAENNTQQVSEQFAISAMAVFQRKGNIWTQRSGEQAKLFVKNAKWPRWSDDGNWVAYFSAGYLYRKNIKTSETISIGPVSKAVALAWHPSSQWIYFSTGTHLKRYSIDGKLEVLRGGINIRELDISKNGNIVATVKSHGYSVAFLKNINFRIEQQHPGCSASFSPSSEKITILRDQHKILDLFSGDLQKQEQSIHHDNEISLDNHFWTNLEDWIAAETEGLRKDIVLLNVITGKLLSITNVGNASRGDVFIYMNE